MKRSIPALCAFASAALMVPTASNALSPGCEALRGGAGLGGQTFAAGEVISITFTAAGGTAGTFSYDLVLPTAEPLFSGLLNGPTTVVRLNVTESASYIGAGSATGGVLYDVAYNCATAVGDANSASVASVSIAGATATTVTNQISARLSSVSSPAPSSPIAGLAGGAGAGAAASSGIWFNVDYTGVSDDFALTALDGDIVTGVVGVDYHATDDVLVGVAATLSGAVVDTDFNLGGVTTITGGLAPYASVRVSENVTFAATAGYLYGHSSSDRRAGAAANGAKIEADYSTRTYLLAGSVSGFVNEGPAVLNGRLGVNWTRAFVSDFEESDGTVVRSQEVTVGETVLELQPSYLVQTEDLLLQPYLLAQYGYRFMQTDIDTQGGQEHPNDRHGGHVGAGLRLYGEQGVSGQIEGRRSVGWQDQSQTSLSGNIRIAF